jgi:hypothetical protein
MSTLSDEQIAQIEKLAWEHARVKWSTPPGYQFDDAELIEFAGAVIEADRAVREKGASPAPADPTVAEVQEYALLWAREVHKLLPLAGKDCNTLDDLEAFLRRLAALAPSPAGEREPIAEIDEFWGIRYCGAESIAEIVKRHGLKAGTKLYAHPAAQPAAPLGAIEWLRRDREGNQAAQPAAPSSSGSHGEGA